MFIILSPAKSLDFESRVNCPNFTTPYFVDQAKELALSLQKLSLVDLGKMMSISSKLADLNQQRFVDFVKKIDEKPNLNDFRQALLAFNGDVYNKIETNKFDDKDFVFAQEHVRILSGLYGLLKPLDLILPYRLEMGTKFKNFSDKLSNLTAINLYEFWGDKITNRLLQEAQKSKQEYIINLASEEYFSVTNFKQTKLKVINVIFKEKRGEVLKIISFNAKRARGLMTNFVIKNKITKIDSLKEFSQEQYRFNKSLSDESNWFFTR